MLVMNELHSKKPTLHLLMGLPGSGKTTLARHLQKITGAVRLSSDDFRLLLFPEPSFDQQEHDNLYKILDHNVEHLLIAGGSVIYDANLNRRSHRDEKYALAKKYKTNVVLWWLKTPDDLSKKRRVEDQNHTLMPDGETPGRMFDRIASVFEAPQKDEKPIVFDGTKVSAENVKQALKNLDI